MVKGRGEHRGPHHSHPQSCCPAPGAPSGAPPPDSAALRSAAGSILGLGGGQDHRLGAERAKKIQSTVRKRTKHKVI